MCACLSVNKWRLYAEDKWEAGLGPAFYFLWLVSLEKCSLSAVYPSLHRISQRLNLASWLFPCLTNIFQNGNVLSGIDREIWRCLGGFWTSYLASNKWWWKEECYLSGTYVYCWDNSAVIIIYLKLILWLDKTKVGYLSTGKMYKMCNTRTAEMLHLAYTWKRVILN